MEDSSTHENKQSETRITSTADEDSNTAFTVCSRCCMFLCVCRLCRQDFGKKIEDTHMSQLSAQLSLFQSQLSAFASQYKHDITANPVLRYQFQQMCSSIGVDPLASNKGFWSSLLGVGDYYYELALQIAEITITSRAVNGGVMTMDEMLIRLTKQRAKQRQNLDIPCAGTCSRACTGDVGGVCDTFVGVPHLGWL